MGDDGPCEENLKDEGGSQGSEGRARVLWSFTGMAAFSGAEEGFPKSRGPGQNHGISCLLLTTTGDKMIRQVLHVVGNNVGLSCVLSLSELQEQQEELPRGLSLPVKVVMRPKEPAYCLGVVHLPPFNHRWRLTMQKSHSTQG